MTVRKIRINDNDELRKAIDDIYSLQEQVIMAKWSLSIAKHMIEMCGIDINQYPDVIEGFKLNELWQIGKAKVSEIRKIGFKVHQIARKCDDEVTKIVFRVIGQAIASGHMKEHSIVASDYAIKVINLLYPNDVDMVNQERKWQLDELIELTNHTF